MSHLLDKPDSVVLGFRVFEDYSLLSVLSSVLENGIQLVKRQVSDLSHYFTSQSR